MADPFSVTGFGRPENIFDIGPGDLVEMTMERMEGWQDWQELQKTAMQVTGEVMREQERTMNVMSEEANSLRATMASARTSLAGAAAAQKGVSAAEAYAAHGRGVFPTSTPIRGGGLGGMWARWQAGQRSLGAQPAGDVRRQTVYQLWYLRVLQQQIDVVAKLGRQVLATAQGWAYYANQVEWSQRMMDQATEALNLGTVALEDQLGPSARLGRELGEHLVPFYDEVAAASAHMSASVADANDSVQAAIAFGTLAAGTFLKVGAGVASAAVGWKMFSVMATSLLPVLGSGLIAVMALAGGIAGITTAFVVGGAVTSKYLSQLKTLEASVMLTAKTYEEYKRQIGAMTEEELIFQAAMSGTGMAFDFVMDTVGKSAEEWEAAGNAVQNYTATVQMSEAAIRGMVLAAQGMVPQAADIFGAGARKREAIQNEILTRQREYEHALAEIEERGGSERAIADLNRRGAELRRLELSLKEAEDATRRALGGIAVSYIQTWAEAVGTPEAFAQAFEATGLAGAEFGMWDETQWKQAQTFMGTLAQGGMGAAPWGEVIEGAGIVADTVTVTGETIVVEGATIYLNPGEYTYLPLPAMKEYTLGDELRTQGVRTR